MRTTIGSWLTILLIAAGCQSQNADVKTSQPPAAETPIATPATAAGGLDLNPLQAKSVSKPVPAAATPDDSIGSPPLVAPERTERVKAETGVGVRGKSLQSHTGMLVEPAKAFFRVEQRVVFDIQIPQAMKLFQATENRLPKSHDEFMSRIVEANQIKLPPLSAGEKYVYDAGKGELMVERPAQ